MKKFILPLVLVQATVSILGQNQEVLSTAGENLSTTDAQLQYTIGEPIILTESQESVTLTQGFHQSNLIVTSISELPNFDISVFPNPVVDLLTIANKEGIEGVQLLLTDVNGKELETRKILNQNTQINFSSFSTGVYFLNLSNEDNSAVKTYKIIKK